MVSKVLPPRVEDSDKTYPAETLPGKLGERPGRRFEEHVVDDLTVSQGKGLELVRQGEDDMEIRNREDSLPLASTHFSFLRNWHLGQCLFLHEL